MAALDLSQCAGSTCQISCQLTSYDEPECLSGSCHRMCLGSVSGICNKNSCTGCAITCQQGCYDVLRNDPNAWPLDCANNCDAQCRISSYGCPNSCVMTCFHACAGTCTTDCYYRCSGCYSACQGQCYGCESSCALGCGSRCTGESMKDIGKITASKGYLDADNMEEIYNALMYEYNRRIDRLDPENGILEEDIDISSGDLAQKDMANKIFRLISRSESIHNIIRSYPYINKGDLMNYKQHISKMLTSIQDNLWTARYPFNGRQHGPSYGPLDKPSYQGGTIRP